MAEESGASVFCTSILNKLIGQSVPDENSYEEKMKRYKPPVQCNTNEDNSEHLHQLYKDTVKHTEPDAEKQRMMKELFSHLHNINEAHDSNVMLAKSSSGSKRRPSVLGHLVHDDSDEEKDDADKTE